MEEYKKGNSVHNIILENRGKLSISGVTDVDSFDDELVALFTEMGPLEIQGRDLRVNKLSIDIGEIMLEGEITSIIYTDESKAEKKCGFFGRMMK